MKHIFLDFDRTLFDTELFYNMTEAVFLKELPKSKDLNLKRFLYSDTLDFLKWCKSEDYKCYLVTFGEQMFQKAKFLACSISEYFAQTFYVEQGRKVDFIKNALKSAVPRENIVFIDDTIAHLEDFAKEMPQSLVLRMCRFGAKGSDVLDDRFVVVKDFNEAKTEILVM